MFIAALSIIAKLYGSNQSAHQQINGGTSLVVQWLRLHAPNAGGLGLIPGRGARSHMHAATKKPICRK